VALKNLANYRVGKNYLFKVGNLGEKTVEIVAKGNKKLQLKVDGNIAWFSADKISLAKKDYHKKVEKPEPKPIIAKESLPPKNEIEQEDISDVTYAFKSFRFELRQILRKHGIKTEQKWPNEKILDLVDKNLR
jgi:hypothetical protein